MTVTKGGSKHIIHYNRKLGKTRRKSLSKFLSKRRRNLLKTIKKGYNTITKSKSSKRRKSSNRRNSSKRRKSLKRRKSSKRSMRGGGTLSLSPADIDFANTANREGNVIEDSSRYSLGPSGGADDSSALANPPTPTRLNDCGK